MKNRTWLVAGPIAAILTAAMPGVHAQDSTAAAPPNTTTAGTMSGGAMSGGAMDYRVLVDPPYDYMDLQQAKARGFSDSQIATIAKIARKTDTPFKQISDDVLRGVSFPVLADKYNLRLADIYDVNDEEQRIAGYKAAYETTGGNAGRAMVGVSSGSMGAGTMGSSGSKGTMSARPMTSSMPMTGSDIIQVLQSQHRFQTLVDALDMTGLTDVLKGTGPFTLFAPTDSAFHRLPKRTLTALMANPDQMKKVLTYHVIPSRVDAATAMAMTTPTSPATVEGDTLQVTTNNGSVMINGNAKVVQADIQAGNGIIHAIDNVLMPPGSTPATAAAP